MAEYYVNPSSGNDTFTGSMAQPFATIAKAILEASPGDTIYLARGYTYSALHITGKDGTAGSPYTWAAYGIGTDPIISAFADPAGSWIDEGGNIWSYQNGLFDQVNVLAVAQSNQPLARWPKPQVADYYPIDAVSGNTSITDNTHLAAAPNFVGGELVSKKRKWTIDRATITGQTSSTISVAGFDTNYVVGNGYFVQNHINCLTAQGDWCYEAGTDTVYFYSTTDPNSLDISISLDEHALHLENSDYHAFHNLIFEGASRHNIFLEFSHNVSFTGCVSRLAGIDGLKTFVSENATWLDGYMYDVNNHGVNNRDASEGLTVTGSSFVRIAAIPGMGQSGSGQQNGVHINNTEHNALIEGNFFFQVGNNGVSYRGNNCYVGRNYAEKCGWTVSDAAAFYSFGNFANPDTNVICEYNIAYDCRGNIDGIGGTPKYDTCGFYTDDNCKDNVTRYNIARKCGYGFYIHNNDGVVYRHNIAEDCDVLFRFADDTTQGVSTTRRIRNVDVQFNTLKALPGQKVYEARVLGVFAGDAPFDFGTIDNNQIDAADASPIQVHLTNNFDNMINLAAWRTDYGFDLNSTTDPYDASGTVFFVNDTAVPRAFSLDGVYEDWDQVANATGEVTLDPNESILLFRVGDFPGPGYPVGKYPGMRFVTLQDRYGQAVYDTYVRAKANNATFGATLMDVKPVADKVLAHAWDMVNVPVAYKDNALYSLIGPDLIFPSNSGENGSRWDKDGLLITGLSGGPRFTFDPAGNGEFEGVYLEVEDINLIPESENMPVGSQNIYISPDGTQNAGRIEILSINSPVNILTGTISESKDYYVSCFVNFVNLVSNRGFQLALYDVGSIISSQYFIINSENVGTWNRLVSKRVISPGQSFDRVRFNGYNNGMGDVYSLWGCTCSYFQSSYIKTSGAPVTRPADTFQATGLINTASPYSLFEIRNGQGILKYTDPGGGTVRTYVDGQYIGEDAAVVSSDLLVNSQGSDKLLAAAYHSGSLTEQERIARSSLFL